MNITIYHNPNCGTSRNVLALIRHAGIEPQVIEYLKNPPSETTLRDLIKRMGITPRQLLRTNVPPYETFDLQNEKLSDDELISAMLREPILINRPIVVSEKRCEIMPSVRNSFGIFTAFCDPVCQRRRRNY